MHSRTGGFTLLEIVVVAGIISLLTALTIPCYLTSRRESRRGTCLNNLRLIEHAKQQLATSSQSLSDSYVPAAGEIAPYFKGCGSPICREGGMYAINAISNDPTCSLAAPFGHVLVNVFQ